MKRILRLMVSFILGGITLVSLTGCLGPAVLSENVVHTPALEPKVELRLKPGAHADVLVLYDDIQLENAKVTRRAFYLNANQSRLEHERRPAFVKLDEIDHLESIPIYSEQPDASVASTNELYAVATSFRHYKLESRGRLVSEFELPRYKRWLTAKKVFLFPAAVGADAAGVAAIAGIAGAYAYAGGTVDGPAIVDAFKHK